MVDEPIDLYQGHARHDILELLLQLMNTGQSPETRIKKAPSELIGHDECQVRLSCDRYRTMCTLWERHS
jgi:hypothetical protein